MSIKQLKLYLEWISSSFQIEQAEMTLLKENQEVCKEVVAQSYLDDADYEPKWNLVTVLDTRNEKSNQ